MRDILRRIQARPVPTVAAPSVADPSVSIDAPENPDNWYGLDYVHDRITVQLQEQSRLWEEADGRLRLILGVIGVVFAAALGLVPRGSAPVTTATGPAQEILYLPFWVGSMAIAAVVLFSAAGLIAMVAYWPRTFSWPPEPNGLREYLTSDEREIKLFVVDAMLDAYDANAIKLARKFLFFRFAFGLAGLAAGMLGASVIIDVLQFTRTWS